MRLRERRRLLASSAVPTTPVISPPAPTGLGNELWGILEFPRLLLRLPFLATQARGNGQPVLVLPGYGASDASTVVLRQYLRFLGWEACGWELGRNHGDVPALLPQVVARLEALADTHGQPVRLVGWSLGGYLAREAARERPHLACSVITLGSPVVGGPKYTVIAPAYRSRGIDLDELEATIDARNRTPLPVPVTAVYSRHDAVVAWEACIDRWSASVEHVEVTASHFGLGFAPDVLAIVADRLRRHGATASPQ